MAARGVTLLPLRKYKTRFAALPKQFREFVLRVWGPPESSKLMTLTSRAGEKYFVIPGVRLGNLFLGPQPLRTTFDRATDVQHDTLTPPPHSYIAAYLWYRHEFHADAVVHMGRHGTLEWLPGKHVGQAGWDSSEVLLADLPGPYYFIIDGDGEAIQARRRAAGVMIGHLTPMIVPGGEQVEYAALHQALEGYEKTAGGKPALAAEYRKQAHAEIRRLKLDAQLGLDLNGGPAQEALDLIHKFLHDIEAGPTPMGQQTVGTLPRDEVVREALAEFLRSGFQPPERLRLGGAWEHWADALVSGSPPSLGNVLDPPLRKKAEGAIAEGAAWWRHLRQSPANELDALVQVLSGRYLVSGLLGDPLRNPASIPSGRNLHDFDTSPIPTRAAWELGKHMAEQTVARYLKQTGKHPEKVSIVLWYGETGRSHGAMESAALALMGVEPRWNSRGVVDGLRLIPDKELGRPRVDVVFTISGIYRDGFGDKLIWLDRASRLAASAGENAIRRNTERVEEALRRCLRRYRRQSRPRPRVRRRPRNVRRRRHRPDCFSKQGRRHGKGSR